MSDPQSAKICAGIPASNNTLLWRIQFSVGDPAAYVEVPDGSGTKKILIIRDIEMSRARRAAPVDLVGCPADYTPESGLSGDRETATAQSAAECLRRAGVTSVVADRTLPLIFAEFIKRAGISVECDTELWVKERRQKNAKEIEHLREAQSVTEESMRYACEMVANAEAGSGGVLYHDGAPLTSERVSIAVEQFLRERDFVCPMMIVAGGVDGADCHNRGSGELKTGLPVIIDIFPRSRQTSYWGDCTRTVVNGEIPSDLVAMHETVCKAKAAGVNAVAPGVTGEDVHKATIAVIKANGYETGLPADDAAASFCAMTHGTGHGVGLDVHEPPLLDFKGPELLVGEALTVEPGLYRMDMGGVRVEDMVVVTEDGCENLNQLPEGLEWKTS